MDLPVPQTPAEFYVARCLREGLAAEFRDTAPGEWSQKIVRAKFLRALVAARLSDAASASVSIVVTDAVISDDLSFRGLGSSGDPHPMLDLSGCEILGSLDLADSRWASVNIDRCTLRGLNASNLKLDNGMSANDLVFDCEPSVSVEFDIGREFPINLGGLVAGANVELRNLGRAFSARSDGLGFCQLALSQARIAGTFDCAGGLLQNAPDTSPEKGRREVLKMDGAQIVGDVIFDESAKHRFESAGEVQLVGINVGGQLSLKGARLENPGGDALSMDRAAIAGTVFLNESDRHRFEAKGEVRLIGAKIGSQLICSGASFSNPGGDALSLDRADIARTVFLDASDKRPFEAVGAIRLPGVKIGGRFRCTGASLENPTGYALSLEGAQVGADVLLRAAHGHPFQANGTVQLRSAQIGLSLECIGRFGAAESMSIWDFDNVSVGNVLKVRLEEGSHGQICLRGARAGELDDDRGRGWGPAPRLPPPGPLSGVLLRLDGFVYERFSSSVASGSPADEQASRSPHDIWRRRIRWLERQTCALAPQPSDYFPQPHEQLAKVLRLMGYDYAARRVACHKSEHESACGSSSLPMSILAWIYRRFFGAGYLPMRALATVVGFWLLGTGLTCVALSLNGADGVVLARSVAPVELVRWLGVPDLVPRSPTIIPPRDKQDGDRTVYAPHGEVQAREVPCTEIRAPLYALDVMVPFVGLHIADKCDISDGAAWGWIYGKALYEIVGWIILAVAALTWTGVLRKDAT